MFRHQFHTELKSDSLKPEKCYLHSICKIQPLPSLHRTDAPVQFILIIVFLLLLNLRSQYVPSEFTNFLLKYNTKDHFSRRFQILDHFPIYSLISPPAPKTNCFSSPSRPRLDYLSSFILNDNFDIRFYIPQWKIFQNYFVISLKMPVMHRKA